MIKKVILIGFILLFVGTCVIPTTALNTDKSQSSKGNWLYVGGNGPGNYTRIQDAINDSSDGDTVFVYHGNYTENIIINKSISVFGENKETTWISGYGYYIYDHVVFLCANNIIFSGFTVYLIEQTCPGIAVNDSQNCIVSNNIVRSTWGIDLLNASNNIVKENNVFTTNGGITIGDMTNELCRENLIENNTIANSGNSGLIYNFGISLWKTAENNIIRKNFLYNCVRDGIWIEDAKNNTIEQNIITCFGGKNRYGIGLMGLSAFGNKLVGNDVSNYTYGVYTNYYQNFLLSGNIIHDNTYGAYLAATPTYLNITNNTFQDNSIGAYIEGGYYNAVEGNIFISNNLGVGIDSSEYTIFRKNNFTNNKEGLIIFMSTECQVLMNNFIGNERHAEFQFCLNTWDNNYWDHPRLFPKPVFGRFLFVQFDWHPAREPYDIPGV